VSQLPGYLRGERGRPGEGRHVRIATRASDLALNQANSVKRELETLGCTVELVHVQTQGDRDLAPFARLSGQGFFTKAVQQALLEGRADLAVHSHKDLPSLPAPGLMVAAVPARADARDVLVMRPEAHDAGEAPFPIRLGASVGSGAARRRDQLARLRPDLQLREMRGNVPTRLRKLREGACDALVLAAAGLDRLTPALDDLVPARLDPDVFVPAPAQGALALEVRRGDDGLAALLTDVHDLAAGRTVAAERGVLAMLQGGCQLALGAHARLAGGSLTLRAYFQGASVAVTHPDAEGAAMLAFDALGRPQGASAGAG
jgi:hydroxymethylbilane synthase